MQPKMTLSEEMCTSFSLRSKESKSEKFGTDHGTSYEVFRNNTTAVEVIVKEVPNKHNKTKETLNQSDKRLQGDIETLKWELAKANSKTLQTRQGIKSLVYELKKQLDAANQRELERHTKNLALELENEKLRTLLDSKAKLVEKLKKEFLTMKRILKLIIKSMGYAPQMSENFTLNSDPEYDDFEKGLKKDVHVKFATNMFDLPGATFDNTMSKDAHSFDQF